jgi:hypothetical protein
MRGAIFPQRSNAFLCVCVCMITFVLFASPCLWENKRQQQVWLQWRILKLSRCLTSDSFSLPSVVRGAFLWAHELAWWRLSVPSHSAPSSSQNCRVSYRLETRIILGKTVFKLEGVCKYFNQNCCQSVHFIFNHEIGHYTLTGSRAV